jgi:hypothetical protein
MNIKRLHGRLFARYSGGQRFESSRAKSENIIGSQDPCDTLSFRLKVNLRGKQHDIRTPLPYPINVPVWLRPIDVVNTTRVRRGN